MGSIIWLLLVVLSSSLIHFGAEGEMMSSPISKEDDLELEKQLKSLNKPPIKTIQTKADIFDCIDIHDQPALDHPSLKNHKIQTSPTSYPKQLIHGTSSVAKNLRAAPNSIDCPYGTVPIRRTRKEDLIRAKSFSMSFASHVDPQTTEFPGQHLAILKSKNVPNLTYNGIFAGYNAYNVTVAINQSSSAQMWIENGPNDQRNSLQMGWMVSPHLFGDNLTRSFSYWTGDGSKTGCYNTLCPGFVQVDKNHAMGDIVTPLSTYGGDQYVWYTMLFQDPATGNWWLTIDDQINVGYWPKALLPNLVGGASIVAWGGLVKGPPNEPSAPMGSGHVPVDNYRKAGYFRQLTIVNASNYRLNPHENQLEKYIDSPTCYQLDYKGYVNEDMGHTILYGGPGGNCGS